MKSLHYIQKNKSLAKYVLNSQKLILIEMLVNLFDSNDLKYINGHEYERDYGIFYNEFYHIEY